MKQQPISISSHAADRFRRDIRPDAYNVKGTLVALWCQSAPATYEDLEQAHLQRYDHCTYHTATYHHEGDIVLVMAVEYSNEGTPVMTTVKRKK